MLGRASELNAEKIDEPAAVGGTEAAIDKAFLTLDEPIEISPVFSDNALRDISTAMGLRTFLSTPGSNQTLQFKQWGIEPGIVSAV